MRIGFDSKRLYCNFTGLGNYSRTLVKNLQTYYPEHEYHLYTPKWKNKPASAFFRNNPHFHTHLPHTPFQVYWRSFSMVRQLRRDNIDLYHGLSNELPFNLRKKGIKSVVTIHDLIFRILPETYPTLDRKIYDLKFRTSCQQADRIIAISENTKKDIVAHYNIAPDKIAVIYQSSDPLFYEAPEPDAYDAITQRYGLPGEYFLFLGGMGKRKNLQFVLKAYLLLAPELRPPLVIVGTGAPHGTALEKWIADNKMEPYLTWVSGLEDNHHLRAVYEKATALLYPSLYEGFGLPVVEALLCKTPVITSSTSALPEAGGPDSLYIDPYDPEALAAAITRIMKNEALRTTMAERGYTYAMQHFRPESVTDRLMTCYQKVLPA